MLLASEENQSLSAEERDTMRSQIAGATGKERKQLEEQYQWITQSVQNWHDANGVLSGSRDDGGMGGEREQAFVFVVPKS